MFGEGVSFTGLGFESFVFGVFLLLFSCGNIHVHLKHQQRGGSQMVVLVGLWRHEGFDKVDVALDSFIYYLLSHDSVEYNVEFDDNFF